MIRSLLAVAAVLAILAMHGVATHASSHTPADHTGTHATSHAVDAPAVADAAPSHGEPGHEMTVLSLCLAVLATAAVLLLRGARPRSGLLAVLPLAGTTSTRPLVVRLPAPPDLHALSVLRC